jgi:rhamnosyltransferase subunit B
MLSGRAPRLHVIMSAIGSLGDLIPFVALGRELVRRGHAVTLVANPRYASLALDSGFEFRAVGTLEGFERFFADADLWDPAKVSLATARATYYYPLMPAFYEVVADVASKAAAPVIVSGEAGAMSAAEKLDVPFVYLACAPALSLVTQSQYDPTHPERVLAPWQRWLATNGRRFARLRPRRKQPVSDTRLPPGHPIARLRHEAGLGPVDAFRPDPALALLMWPEWFAPRQPDWPDVALTTGFPFLDARPMPVRSPRPAAEAPIVVTTGTVAGSQFAFYNTVVEACTGIGRPTILVTPHENHVPTPLPPSITWLAHAPFGDLFPRAALVLHHGGIGTVAQAMAAGVPQVVLPMRWDQFDTASRVQRLGTGAVLAPGASSAGTLRKTIQGLIGSTRVAARCRHWQTQVDVRSAVVTASDAIERTAVTQQVRTSAC